MQTLLNDRASNSSVAVEVYGGLILACGQEKVGCVCARGFPGGLHVHEVSFNKAGGRHCIAKIIKKCFL